MLASSANPATVGQSVTFTATVTGAGGTPTGTVTFKDGATSLGGGTLGGGVATFTTAALAAGSHTITTLYSGDTTFAPEHRAALTQVITPPAARHRPRGLQFYPLAQPVRLLDTRPGATAFLTPGAPLSPTSPSTCPGASPTAASPSPPPPRPSSATPPSMTPLGAPAGFATLYPSGSALPLASNLNFVPGTVRPNAFTVAFGSDGTFNLLSNTGGHFIVDLTGYYAPPGTGGLFFHPLTAPVRLLDTRPGQSAVVHPGAALAAGQTLNLPGQFTIGGITVPSSAKALAGNATVDNTWQCAPRLRDPLPRRHRPAAGEQPQLRPRHGGAERLHGRRSAATARSTCTPTRGGHFIVDVTGYYDADRRGRPALLPPRRSRCGSWTRGAGQSASVHPGAALAAGQTLNLPGSFTFGGMTVPAEAKALVGNATVDNSGNAPPGFATLYPGGTTLPLASNLNYVPGTVAPNAFVVGVGADGTYNLYSSSGGNFIVDISGYFAAGAGTSAAPARDEETVRGAVLAMGEVRHAVSHRSGPATAPSWSSTPRAIARACLPFIRSISCAKVGAVGGDPRHRLAIAPHRCPVAIGFVGPVARLLTTVAQRYQSA